MKRKTKEQIQDAVMLKQYTLHWRDISVRDDILTKRVSWLGRLRNFMIRISTAIKKVIRRVVKK